MDLSERLNLSYYRVIAVLNEPHQIFLVQHQESGKVYVKKVLTVYNGAVYDFLYHHPIPGTPKIEALFPDGEKLILIEEYVSGDLLLDRIEKKTLTRDEILQYMLDLCSVLHVLHGQNPPIIHRDIKPGNIMITSCNRAVLLDFNAAKQYSASEETDTVLLGTKGYAAPEQYGFGSSSPQTDIYALGVTLREMVTSAGINANRLFAIIERCTQMDPAKRYGSVDELYEDIRRLKDGDPEVLVPAGVRRFLPPGFRSGTPWKMALAAIAYVLLIAFCFTMKFTNADLFMTWLERLLMLGICLTLILVGYLDVQRLMPLCRSRNPVLHYLGIALTDLIVICVITVVLIFVLTLHSS